MDRRRAAHALLLVLGVGALYTVVVVNRGSSFRVLSGILGLQVAVTYICAGVAGLADETMISDEYARVGVLVVPTLVVVGLVLATAEAFPPSLANHYEGWPVLQFAVGTLFPLVYVLPRVETDEVAMAGYFVLFLATILAGPLELAAYELDRLPRSTIEYAAKVLSFRRPRSQLEFDMFLGPSAFFGRAVLYAAPVLLVNLVDGQLPPDETPTRIVKYVFVLLLSVIVTMPAYFDFIYPSNLVLAFVLGYILFTHRSKFYALSERIPR